jgi:hypothetical protein
MSTISESEAVKLEWLDHEYTQAKLHSWRKEWWFRLKGLKNVCSQTTDPEVARVYGELSAAEQVVKLLEGDKHGNS